ncbi:MAG TPA: response regulator [Candidatus Omnitrophota bacterium]|nr:response regulator [Candidatus Omnitrophota bacterium]HPW76827.1 response regulator [Candidatus Omnitrophota bacterium]HQB11485.1 response regulator [Candidatus Omnitrophota bacterium]HQB11489.1 response regulator [Candidatus Omnitrophota bacterium]
MAKIVIVDDEEDLLEFMESYFKSRGHEVFTAVGGREAIPLILNQRPDVALIDVRLKDDVDGLKVIRDVRGKAPDQKIILMTAYNDKDEEGIACGATLCIHKPTSLNEIETAVLNVINAQ